MQPMQPFDVSLNSVANQGTLQANGALPQSGPVISSYTQPPTVLYVQQAPQDNSNKMAQRAQLVKTYKDQASSFGRYCAMLFSFLSVIAGGVVSYVLVNSDYWSAVKEIEGYASDIQDAGDILSDVKFGSYASDAIDSCVTFATCIQFCGYLAIGFAIYHGLIFFLSCCMTKQGGCVMFLIIFEVVILIGSGVLAYEISNNECKSLIDDIVNAGDTIMNFLGIDDTINLNNIELPDSTNTYCIIFAVASLLNAITFCCWNSNISQARKDEQQLALKLAMIS